MSHPTLRRDSEGSAVERLQNRLIELGYDLAADGIFGHDTHAAVVEFQESNGLSADGVVGHNTWVALGF